MNSSIKNEIKAAEKKAQYDARAKRLLSNKYILAYILQEAVAEFKNESVQVIVGCIENDIRISSVPAEPGETNRRDDMNGDKMDLQVFGEQITGNNTEDKVPDEGTIYFDILFSARLPEKGEEKEETRVKIIVNVEAQKKKPSTYRLANRAVYYACRMISSQKTREFNGSDYNGIKRVYSIWICMNMPGDSLHSMHLVDECAFGKAELSGGVDLINILFVELAKDVPDAQTKHRLHRLLGALLSKTMIAQQKWEVMREYEIPLENGMKEEINIMCNLGEGIEEMALEEGREQGREEGREEGREQGREEILLTQITKKVNKGKSLEQIADELEETQEAILPLYQRVTAG